MVGLIRARSSSAWRGFAVDSSAWLSIRRSRCARCARCAYSGAHEHLEPTPSSCVLARLAWQRSDTRGPRWLQLLWTLLFSAGCGLFFAAVGFVTVADDGLHWRTDVGWWHFLGVNLVVAFCIGLAIRALFVGGNVALGYERVQALTGWRRWLYFVGLPLLGWCLAGMQGVVGRH